MSAMPEDGYEEICQRPQHVLWRRMAFCVCLRAEHGGNAGILDKFRWHGLRAPGGVRSPSLPALPKDATSKPSRC